MSFNYGNRTENNNTIFPLQIHQHNTMTHTAGTKRNASTFTKEASFDEDGNKRRSLILDDSSDGHDAFMCLDDDLLEEIFTYLIHRPKDERTNQVDVHTVMYLPLVNCRFRVVFSSCNLWRRADGLCTLSTKINDARIRQRGDIVRGYGFPYDVMLRQLIGFLNKGRRGDMEENDDGYCWFNVEQRSTGHRFMLRIPEDVLSGSRHLSEGHRNPQNETCSEFLYERAMLEEFSSKFVDECHNSFEEVLSPKSVILLDSLKLARLYDPIQSITLLKVENPQVFTLEFSIMFMRKVLSILVSLNQRNMMLNWSLNSFLVTDSTMNEFMDGNFNVMLKACSILRNQMCLSDTGNDHLNLPPEPLDSPNYDSEGRNVWGSGFIFLELLMYSGFFSFRGVLTHAEVIVLMNEPKAKKKIITMASPKGKLVADLLTKMMAYNPEDRISLQSLLCHPLWHENLNPSHYCAQSYYLNLETNVEVRVVERYSDGVWRKITAWVYLVIDVLHLPRSTAFSTFQIALNFCSSSCFSEDKLDMQLIIAASLFISCKVYFVKKLSFHDICYCMDNDFSPSDLLRAESVILQSLEFKILPGLSTLDFLDRMICQVKVLRPEYGSKWIAHSRLFADIILLMPISQIYMPSGVSACILLISLKKCDDKSFSDCFPFQCVTGWSLKDIFGICKEIKRALRNEVAIMDSYFLENNFYEFHGVTATSVQRLLE